jgi:hypothetical protein
MAPTGLNISVYVYDLGEISKKAILAILKEKTKNRYYEQILNVYRPEI